MIDIHEQTSEARSARRRALVAVSFASTFPLTQRSTWIEFGVLFNLGTSETAKAIKRKFEEMQLAALMPPDPV